MEYYDKFYIIRIKNKTKENIAKNMLNKSMAIKDIFEITNLSIKKIKKL